MIGVPITNHGVKKLRAELERLKNIERPRIIAAISDARAHGDLRENAEYHAAREQQSFVEGRILDLERKLANCQIIDVTQLQNQGRVVFGATVTLLHQETEQVLIYQIVGEDEADIKTNKLSITSPTARALIGKYVEDIVEVSTPEKILRYHIVNVEYL